jgi:hypothetical protein
MLSWVVEERNGEESSHPCSSCQVTWGLGTHQAPLVTFVSLGHQGDDDD